MWETFAKKYLSDRMYRNAIDILADQYGDKMASAIKSTAMGM